MPLCHRLIKLGFVLVLLALAGPLMARTMKAQIGSISTGAGKLEQVRVLVDWPEGARFGQAVVSAKKLDFPFLSYTDQNIVWRCRLTRADAQNWQCTGPLRTPRGLAKNFSVSLKGSSFVADMQIDQSRLRFSKLEQRPNISDIDLQNIPVAWLKAYLKTLWAEANWTQGSVSGKVAIKTPPKAPFEVDINGELKSLGLETPQGTIAAANVTSGLKLNYREQANNQQISIDFSPRAGEVLFNSFYGTFPGKPLSGTVIMQRSGTQPWRLNKADWNDPGVMQVRSQWQLDRDGVPQTGDMRVQLDDLSVARDRYLSGFLAPAGFSGLNMKGALDASISMREGQLTQASAVMKQVTAQDANQRFEFNAINGNLIFTRGSEAQNSALRWQSAAVYGMQLGATEIALQSSAGKIRQTQGSRISVLGGNLLIDDLNWSAPSKDRGTAFDFSAQLQAIDLASLSKYLGWPEFTGTLEGRLPKARYENSIMNFDGGFAMNLFGGKINVGDLVMERPFGVAPTLSANVTLDDLDLQPMTKAFDFGEIQGRLDGTIRDLRLLDWSPIAFKAKLQTDSTWKGKRRLSQRAVNDLSNVGGSGVVTGLQNQVLKVFDDFGYDKIGLGCELKENVCTMDGVGSAGDGYIIVDGKGLPRIQVVGFRKRVDWPTLIARLKAASSGQTPVIK